MRVSDDYQFEAGSPVGRYWLIHGVGFTVCRKDGRKLGVVEDVVVDPIRVRAEQVIVRRRGLLLRRRHVTIDAGALEAVVPASRLLLVASPPRAAPAVARAAALVRRLSARGARAVARLAVVAARRARREAPGLARWLGRAARVAARHLGAAARIAARGLGELAVLVAVLAAAAWRRASALSTPRAPPPDARPDAPQGPSDADAALGREMKGQVPSNGRREGSARRISADAGSDRHSDH